VDHELPHKQKLGMHFYKLPIDPFQYNPFLYGGALIRVQKNNFTGNCGEGT
jgi:hypothetical protein